MGNNLPISSLFHIQTVSESDLNYDEMTKCPSITMKIIKDSTQPNPTQPRLHILRNPLAFLQFRRLV
ncbi:hypothetical protein TL16_g02877 [Triparma laevis f. inornata]|uniref:Uncharacterized protein n=2 Tax=Triparma laevis TaxID=1534972 RepID=A0A9W7FGR3_9STRA|nr:hypothetical protein TL16_g02877 [Triparma laevis f. inornata]GMI11805.1 hypothetical protein TrLO_g14749 [Triparma laevis f. longispina]